MNKRKQAPRLPSASNIEDAWQRLATAAAIEKARAVVCGGAVPPNTLVGQLSDIEWGWIVASILFGWISTRAEQATAEGLDAEQTIRLIGLDPDPWDAGVIATILSDLANVPGLDWTKPLAAFSRDEIVRLLFEALRLVRRGMIARDLGSGITRKSSPDMIARNANAASGGPLMTPDELNDEIAIT
jgi:hypothetical protein